MKSTKERDTKNSLKFDNAVLHLSHCKIDFYQLTLEEICYSIPYLKVVFGNFSRVVGKRFWRKRRIHFFEHPEILFHNSLMPAQVNLRRTSRWTNNGTSLCAYA